ncbi:MAG TPA: prepilin-type N-terminal cleavage/methylation domain-containing protein [Pyrinomonadaceae bacterium]|jgi:Tfp pilus assembly protein PilV|nr:prepilin-type N-terminal cleavage/methylation domain-containing protein [Pyrinomonadaceae bacterium]
MKIRTPKTKTANGEGGFTLLETSIAMVVMMVGSLACASLFVFSIQNNVGGSERALSMAVAQQQLEQLRSVDYEDSTLNDLTTNFSVTTGGRAYNVQREVVTEKNSDDKSKELKKITIAVTPQGTGPNWTRTAVVLVSYRSTMAGGSYKVAD